MKKQYSETASLARQMDWSTTLIPLLCILALCAWFMLSPEQSAGMLETIRSFLNNELGSYYLIMGLGAFLCAMYMAFSNTAISAWGT